MHYAKNTSLYLFIWSMVLSCKVKWIRQVLIKPVVRNSIEDGLIEETRSGLAATAVRLTSRGILFCDTVSSAFL